MYGCVKTYRWKFCFKQFFYVLECVETQISVKCETSLSISKLVFAATVLWYVLKIYKSISLWLNACFIYVHIFSIFTWVNFVCIYYLVKDTKNSYLFHHVKVWVFIRKSDWHKSSLIFCYMILWVSHNINVLLFIPSYQPMKIIFHIISLKTSKYIFIKFD